MHNILSSMLYESLNNDSKKLLVKLQKLIIKADKILELIECFTELPQKYIDIEVAKMAKQYIANVNQLCTGLSIKVPKFYITNEDEAQKLAESTIDIAYINKMYKTLELEYNFCVEYNISSAIFSWQKQPPY